MVIKSLIMITVNGVYENGIVRLDRKIRAKKKMKVIVTFLDEEQANEPKRLKIEDFSFLEAREKSKRFKGSLSDAVIEDRKSEI
jgi:hypothetical protein